MLVLGVGQGIGVELLGHRQCLGGACGSQFGLQRETAVGVKLFLDTSSMHRIPQNLREVAAGHPEHPMSSGRMPLMPFSTTQVVYASLLGLAFFDEAISWLQVLGAVFLAVGILEVNRQKISLLNVAASEGHAAIHDPEGQHLLGATSDQDEDGLPSKVVEGVHSLLLPLKHEPHSGQQGSPLH